MEPKSVTVRYTISPQDYLEAVRLDLRSARRYFPYLAGLILLEAFVPHDGRTHHFVFGPNNAFLLGLLAFSFLYSIIHNFWLLPGKIAKIYARQKLLHDEITLALTDAGWTLTTAHDSNVAGWDVFPKWKEYSGLILVYRTRRLFHIVPKRAFASEEDLQWFIEVLKANIRKGNKKDVEPGRREISVDAFPVAPDSVQSELLTVRYTLLPEDAVEVVRFNMRRFVFIIFGTALVALVITCAVTQKRDPSSFTAVRLPILLLLAFIVIWYVWWLPWKIRRNFRQRKQLHDEITVEITEEGTTSSSTHGRTAMDWEMFYKWKETPKTFLLYHSQLLFNAIPKRAFSSEEDLQWFRGLLTAKILKSGK